MHAVEATWCLPSDAITSERDDLRSPNETCAPCTGPKTACKADGRGSFAVACKSTELLPIDVEVNGKSSCAFTVSHTFHRGVCSVPGTKSRRWQEKGTEEKDGEKEKKGKGWREQGR